MSDENNCNVGLQYMRWCGRCHECNFSIVIVV